MSQVTWSAFAVTWLAVLLAAGPAQSGDIGPRRPGVVFVVHGAGDYRCTTGALCQAIAESGLRLTVEEFRWSHGFCPLIADEIDYAHARGEGRRLAGQVAAYRRVHPGGEVYLVGHSAGSAVVLAAAEALPPAAVTRILLFAPSVSACYDLRPALCTARDGIDVFFSRRDRWFLGVGVWLVGTADRRGRVAAGRTGFRPVAATPADAALYAKLRQHPWHSCLAWTGNHGRHYDGYRPGYLRAYVLPLLCGKPGATRLTPP